MSVTSVKHRLEWFQAAVDNNQGLVSAPTRCLAQLDKDAIHYLKAAPRRVLLVTWPAGPCTAIGCAAVPRFAAKIAESAGWLADHVQLVPELVLTVGHRLVVGAGALLGTAVGGRRGREWGEVIARSVAMPLLLMVALVKFVGAVLHGAVGVVAALVGALIGLGVGVSEGRTLRREGGAGLKTKAAPLIDIGKADLRLDKVEQSLGRLRDAVRTIGTLPQASAEDRDDLSAKVDAARLLYPQLRSGFGDVKAVIAGRTRGEWHTLFYATPKGLHPYLFVGATVRTFEHLGVDRLWDKVHRAEVEFGTLQAQLCSIDAGLKQETRIANCA